MQELNCLISMSEKILEKWKNFVMNTLFDDKRNNKDEFSKSKMEKKLENKS